MSHIAGEVITAAAMNALETAVAGIPADVTAAVASDSTVITAAAAAVADAVAAEDLLAASDADATYVPKAAPALVTGALGGTADLLAAEVAGGTGLFRVDHRGGTWAVRTSTDYDAGGFWCSGGDIGDHTATDRSVFTAGATQIFRPRDGSPALQVGMPWLLFGMSDGKEAFTLSIAHDSSDYFGGFSDPSDYRTVRYRDSIIRGARDALNGNNQRVLLGVASDPAPDSTLGWTLAVDYESICVKADDAAHASVINFANDQGIRSALSMLGASASYGGIYQADQLAVESGGAGGLLLGSAGTARAVIFQVGSSEVMRLTASKTVQLAASARPAFASGDKYLVVNSSGEIHVSALGPAS